MNVITYILPLICIGIAEVFPTVFIGVTEGASVGENKIFHIDVSNHVFDGDNDAQIRDEVCDVCKEMISEARNTLNSNETQTELLEVLEGSCALLKLKPVVEACDKMMLEFADYLIEALTSQMDPTFVCVNSGLCDETGSNWRMSFTQETGRSISNFMRAIKLIIRNDNNALVVDENERCGTCVKGFEYVTTPLKERLAGNPQTVRVTLLSICPLLAPQHKDMCKQVVDKNDQKITAMVLKIDDEEICENLGQCQNDAEGYSIERTTDLEDDAMIHNDPSLADDDNLECEFCEKVVKHWAVEWSSKTSIEELKSSLESMCHEISNVERQSRCLRLVDEYYIPWFNLLLHEVDPHLVCHWIALCPTEEVKVMKGYDLPTLDENEHVQQINSKSLVDGSHYSKSLEMEFQNALNTFMTAGVIKIREEEADMSNFSPRNKVTTTAVDRKGTICMICKFLDKEMVKRFDVGRRTTNNPSHFLNSLKELCSNIPSQKAEHRCNAFISALGPDFMKQWIIQHLSTVTSYSTSTLRRERDVCSNLMKVCTTSNVYNSNRFNSRVIANSVVSIGEGLRRRPSSPYMTTRIRFLNDGGDGHQSNSVCDVCKYGVKMLDQIVDRTDNVEKIIDEMRDICQYLPSSIGAECNSLVQQYGAYIIYYFTKGLTPEEVCEEIELCAMNDAVVLINPAPAVSREENDDSSNKCTLCKIVINSLDTIIVDRDDIEDVRRQLEHVCLYLPNVYRPPCKDFVDENAEKIVAIFQEASRIPPEQVCEELNMCIVRHAFEAELEQDHIETPVDVEMDVPDESRDDEIMISDSDCVYCKFAIRALDTMIDDRANLHEVKEKLDKVCMFFAVEYRARCDELVDEYAEKIVEYMHDVANLSPEQVCTKLDLCIEIETPPTTGGEVESRVGRPFRTLCQHVMEKIEEFFKDDEVTEDKVIHYLDQVCYDLSAPVVGPCVRWVKSEADWIVYMMKSGDRDARYICKHLPN